MHKGLQAQIPHFVKCYLLNGLIISGGEKIQGDP
jgi:hypothetical protein